MKNKKNIDRLFQERFKDFESAPNDQTWSKIQTGLKEEKKERKIIPLWFKYSGIAVAFFVGFFSLNTLYKSQNSTKYRLENNIVIPKESLDSNNNTTVIIDSTSRGIKKTMEEIKSLSIAVGDSSTNTIQHESYAKTTNNTTSKQKNAIVNSQQNNSKSVVKNLKNSRTESLIANQYLLKKETNSSELQFPGIITEAINKNDNLVVNQDQSESKRSNEIIVPNELEVILAQKKDLKDKVVSNNVKRWEIAPNVSAMYPNSKVANIDPEFNQNSKSSDKSVGFGIGIKYAVSKKMVLRTGINKFDLGFNTNNVTYSSGLNTTALANVSYTENAMIEIRNNKDGNPLMSFEKDLQKTNSGIINQKMGYYEIPLEVSYAILDRKMGISVIAGVSTLFLDENKISLISPDNTIQLGEANNLNSVNFSTNIGLGFQYKFIKSFQLNLEPMFKYQLNTFNTNSGTKPLIFGLYSGISYHF